METKASTLTSQVIDGEAYSLRETVRQGYAAIAQQNVAPVGMPSCCGSAVDSATELATALGYATHELALVPESNLGLSCGNPTALATLQPGEVVLDLGSGGGFDVFIAGGQVGAEGRAIGVDMTAEMLAKARANATVYRERTGLDNVEFRLGEIEHLPVPDASVDVVISNCVINLSSDKAQVWREIARVLRPGGRVAVSDIALVQELPPAVAERVEALVGCFTGAVQVEDTLGMVEACGLVNIETRVDRGSVDAMVETVHDELFSVVVDGVPEGAKASDYAVSLALSARKPG